MHLEYDPNDYEAVHRVNICDFHKDNPTEQWAGCSCYGSFSLVRKNFEAIKEYDESITTTKG